MRKRGDASEKNGEEKIRFHFYKTERLAEHEGGDAARSLPHVHPGFSVVIVALLRGLRGPFRFFAVSSGWFFTVSSG